MAGRSTLVSCVAISLGIPIYILVVVFLYDSPSANVAPIYVKCRNNACEMTDYVDEEIEKFQVYVQRHGNVSAWCQPHITSDANCTALFIETIYQLTYAIKVSQPEACMTSCVLVRIREFTKNVKRGNYVSAGGSDLHLLVHGNDGRRYTCLIRDHFNGSYTGYCPLYGGCLSLMVTLQHYGFIGYLPHAPHAAKRVIWQGRLCPREPHEKTPAIAGSSTPYIGWWTDPDSNSSKPEETWKGLGGPWLRVRAEMDLKRCLQTRIRSFTVFGDSHLTYVRAYFLYLLDKLTPEVGKTHRDDWVALGPARRQVGKTRYYPTAHASSLARAFNEFANHLSANGSALRKNDVIVFNAGAWDVFERGVEHYIKQIATIARFVEAVRNETFTCDATVAFFTIPPVQAERNRITSYNSNAQMAAANAYVIRELRRRHDLRVHVIDYYVMLIAHYEKGVDHHHVISPHQSGTKIVGEVGKQATAEGFRQICTIVS